MPGTPLKLGPFIGGMNTQADPSSISDNELVDCVNLELDLDGSLVSRPPVVDITAGSNISALGGNVVLLGYGIFSSNRYYLFGCGPSGVGVYYNNVWTLIAPGVRSKSIVQFMDKVWILAKFSSTNPGGSYNPDSGYVAVPAMPRGSTIVTYKSRLWICAGAEAPPATASRISWSAFDVNGASTPDVWNSLDFLNVNPGDGQHCIDLVVYNDTLVIFKDDSTYSFPFDVDPRQGVIRKISGNVGATRDFCVVQYENVLYCYHEGWVYEINNYTFTRLNTKVPFEYEAPSAPLADESVYLTLFGDRLVCRYYRRAYIFNLRTRTWTRFKSTYIVGPFVSAPSTNVQRKNQVYYAGSNVAGQQTMYKTQDGFDSAAKEPMDCLILTKNYDMGLGYKFKKLFWWGADVSSVNPVLGIVTIITTGFTVTWGALSQYTWDDLLTWGNPTGIAQIGSISSSVPLYGNRPNRVFLKFFKALRYRQINFSVGMTTDGSDLNGPVRVYTLTAFTSSKETVVKAVS